MYETRRKGVAEAMAPYLLLIMLVVIVIIAILAYLQAMSVVNSDMSKTTSYALHAILESTECTPVTKMSFRDVLAIGVVEGKTSGSFGGDTVQIEYGGKTEPGGVKPVTCFNNLKKNVIAGDIEFYVEHPVLCPPSTLGGSGCYGETAIGGTNYNIESSEYIALPNGDVARVVLKTKG